MYIFIQNGWRIEEGRRETTDETESIRSARKTQTSLCIIYIQCIYIYVCVFLSLSLILYVYIYRIETRRNSGKRQPANSSLSSFGMGDCFEKQISNFSFFFRFCCFELISDYRQFLSCVFDGPKGEILL